MFYVILTLVIRFNVFMFTLPSRVSYKVKKNPFLRDHINYIRYRVHDSLHLLLHYNYFPPLTPEPPRLLPNLSSPERDVH